MTTSGTHARLQVASRVSAAPIMRWLHKETSDHVHKSLYITGITSLDGQTAHVVAFSTMGNELTTVFTFTSQEKGQVGKK